MPGRQEENPAGEQTCRSALRWGRHSGLPRRSAPGAEELLDRIEDGVAVGDAAAHDVLALAEHLVNVFVKLARAVGALDLSVAEQVQLRQQFLVQQLDTVRDVIAPVV